VRQPLRILTAALLLPLALAGRAAAQPRDAGLAPCSIAGVEGQARCGVIHVPQDPAAPAGRRLALRVVVLRALSPPAADGWTWSCTGGAACGRRGRCAGSCWW